MYQFKFIFEGKPKGKERPRTVRKNGRVWTYTPKSTKEFEEKIRLNYLESPDIYNMPFNPKNFGGDIKVYIDAYFSIPKSYSDSKKFLMENAPCTKKPDCDNIAKSILDSLNGIAYKDDSQIYEIHVTKRYSRNEGIVVQLNYYNEK